MLSNTTSVIAVQFWNAFAPIDLTPVGMLTIWRLVHPARKLAGIEVSELGRRRDVRLVQPLKISLADMLVSLSPKETMLRLVQPEKSSSPIEVSLLFTLNSKMKSEVQLLNAFLAIEVTVSGTSIELILEHPSNALSPIDVTPSWKRTLSRDEQL